ncbi:hypothetical protein R75465_02688 [Paraburkholderia aspalathi]|nr:hypothetical protein R75465_02688 [Paraburkholderia aspalathi]
MPNPKPLRTVARAAIPKQILHEPARLLVKFTNARSHLPRWMIATHTANSPSTRTK